MRTSLLFISLVLAALAACGPKAGPKTGLGDAAQAPIPPFTAAQIYAGMPEGERRVFRLVDGDGPAVLSEWLVVAADADAVTFRFTQRDANGELLGEPAESTSAWAELETHARFPLQATTWSDGPVTVPAGTFSVARTYVVNKVEDGHPVEIHYTFAQSLPGPPVRMVTLRHGDEIQCLELVERAPPE